MSERTGLSTGALRMWEQRYGFPAPQRLPGGHRRYAESDVADVRKVLELREAGVRIELAVAQVHTDPEPGVPSVYATLRSRHPHLPVQRLKKATLIAMSWAIEDEFAARAERSQLWGAFQQERFYRPAAPRWREMARVSGKVTVLADFARSDLRARPRQVALGPDAPMRREWAVVVDSASFPIALTAFELPGQDHVPDRMRVFETVWTLEPAAVRDAAMVCHAVAEDALRSDPETRDDPDAALAPPVLGVTPPVGGAADPVAVTALLARMVEYLDRMLPQPSANSA